MFSRKSVALNSFLAIVIGVFFMVEWQMNMGEVNSLFAPYISMQISFFIIPVLISVGVYLICFETVPIIAVYLIFTLFEAISGRISDSYAVYNYGVAFIISYMIAWAFKKLLSY